MSSNGATSRSQPANSNGNGSRSGHSSPAIGRTLTAVRNPACPPPVGQPTARYHYESQGVAARAARRVGTERTNDNSSRSGNAMPSADRRNNNQALVSSSCVNRRPDVVQTSYPGSDHCRAYADPVQNNASSQTAFQANPTTAANNLHSSADNARAPKPKSPLALDLTFRNVYTTPSSTSSYPSSSTARSGSGLDEGGAADMPSLGHARGRVRVGDGSGAGNAGMGACGLM